MTYGILREVSRDPFKPASRSVNFRHCPNCDAWLIDPDFLSDFLMCPLCNHLYTQNMMEVPDDDVPLEEVQIYK